MMIMVNKAVRSPVIWSSPTTHAALQRYSIISALVGCHHLFHMHYTLSHRHRHCGTHMLCLEGRCSKSTENGNFGCRLCCVL